MKYSVIYIYIISRRKLLFYSFFSRFFIYLYIFLFLQRLADIPEKRKLTPQYIIYTADVSTIFSLFSSSFVPGNPKTHSQLLTVDNDLA